MDEVYEIDLQEEHKVAAEELNINPKYATAKEIIGLCGYLCSNSVDLGRAVEEVCKGSKKKSSQKFIIGEYGKA